MHRRLLDADERVLVPPRRADDPHLRAPVGRAVDIRLRKGVWDQVARHRATAHADGDLIALRSYSPARTAALAVALAAELAHLLLRAGS